MKWNHLPESGGIYDQHPLLIERFYYIMGKQAEEDEKQSKKNRADMGKNAPKPSMGGRARRPR